MSSGIPTRYRLRLKQRLAVVTCAEEYGVKPAGRRFGLNRKTVREWRDHWRLDGEQGCCRAIRFGAGRREDLDRARAPEARHCPDDSARVSGLGIAVLDEDAAPPITSAEAA